MVGSDDDRAVSETAGVAILVVFTLLVTASVGISVLFVEGDDTGGPNANFSFDHRSGSSMLLVTHQRGDAVPAGQLVLENNVNSVTWAEVANSPDNETIGPGDLIQLSANSAWGEPVRRNANVDIYYAPGDGNRTLLDSWSG